MKKLLLSSIVCGCLFVSSIGTASPVPVNYISAEGSWKTADLGRSIMGIVEGIMKLCGEGESKAQLIATQEEVNKNACGGGGSSGTTDTSQGVLGTEGSSAIESLLGTGSAGESEFSGLAFDYTNENLLQNNGNVGYSGLKSVMSLSGDSDGARGNIKQKILEEFFADPTKSEESTREYQEKVLNKRKEYVREASRRHITLAYRVKENIQGDLAAITSAGVSGDGDLGSIAVDSHTLEQMIKVALVDLAIQIEMMEADAIQFLIHQPVVLMSETKPSATNSNSNS